MGARYAAWLFLLAVSPLVGCVVVDVIEFDDAVNHPPEVISATPPGEMISIYLSEGEASEQSFGVVVQDPDEDEAQTTLLEGRLTLSNSYIPARTFTCEPPRQPTVLLTSGSDEAGAGALVYIECKLSSLSLADVPQGVPTTVTLEVSDLGYTARNVVPEDANTVAVDWVVEVEQ